MDASTHCDDVNGGVPLLMGVRFTHRDIYGDSCRQTLKYELVKKPITTIDFSFLFPRVCIFIQPFFFPMRKANFYDVWIFARNASGIRLPANIAHDAWHSKGFVHFAQPSLTKYFLTMDAIEHKNGILIGRIWTIPWKSKGLSLDNGCK